MFNRKSVYAVVVAEGDPFNSAAVIPQSYRRGWSNSWLKNGVNINFYSKASRGD